MENKVCKRCHILSPLEQFRPFYVPGTKEVRGRRAMCRKCESKHQLRRYRKQSGIDLIESCVICKMQFKKLGKSITCSKECSRINKNRRQSDINARVKESKGPRVPRVKTDKEPKVPTRTVKMLEVERKPGKVYLENRDLYIEILISKEMGILTKKASDMFQIIGKGVISKFRYSDPDNKMDSYQCGMLKMFKFWYNFDENKSHNAFAYFTEIFKRGMAEGFKEVRGEKRNFNHISLGSQDYFDNYI